MVVVILLVRSSEKGGSHYMGLTKCWSANPRDPPVSASQFGIIRMRHPTQQFSMGSEKNSGPHACKVSTLPTVQISFSCQCDTV